MRSIIETDVGRDLQYIRFNGTPIGGLMGVALYHAIQLLPSLGLSVGEPAPARPGINSIPKMLRCSIFMLQCAITWFIYEPCSMEGARKPRPP